MKKLLAVSLMWLVALNSVWAAPPVAIGVLADVTVDEDDPPVVVDVSTALVDADMDATYSVSGNSNAALVNTSLSGSLLTLTFAPDGNGSANLTIRADDGTGFAETGLAVFVNPINDAPKVASTIGDQIVSEDAPDLVINLSGVFADDENDPLTYTVTGGNVIVGAAISGPASLTLSFAPNANGNAVISVQADDGNGGTTTDSFAVTVTPVNDPPTVAAPIPDVTVAEDAPSQVINLAGVFADIDADPLTLSVTGGNAIVGAVLTGPTTLTLTFAPDANGTATISVQADDGNGGTVVDSFLVTVSAVNDPPTVAAPIPDVTVAEDAPSQVINLAGVFADIDADPLALSVTGGNALVGAVLTGPTTLTLTFAPDANGTATISVQADDSNGGTVVDSFLVTVTPVNDPPTVISPINDVTVAEDAGDQVVSLAGVFTDIDGGPLAYSVTANTNGAVVGTAVSGASLTLSFAADANGVADITVQADDGNGGTVTDTFTVTVTPVNDAPRVVAPIADLNLVEDPGDQVFNLTTVFTDPDGDALTFTASHNNGALIAGAVVTGGTLTVSFVANRSGIATITVVATDPSSLTATDAFDIQITSAFDDVPIANNDTVPPIVEDNAGTVIDVLANDFTEDAPVTITQAGVVGTIDGVTGFVSEGPASTLPDANGDMITQPNGFVEIQGLTVVYRPKPNFSGPDFFTYTITDADGDTSTATVNLTVTAVNDPPVGSALLNYTVEENDFLAIVSPGVLVGAFDVDGDSIESRLDTAPANGTVTLELDGSFVYTPVVNFVGIDQFTYFLHDGTVPNSGTAYVVRVTVTPRDPAPPPPPADEVVNPFDLAQVPLELAKGVEANVLVTMDDSGSMDWTLLAREAGATDGRMRAVTLGNTQTFSYLLPQTVLATNTFAVNDGNGRGVPSQEAIDADVEMVGNTFGVWRARSAKYNPIYYNPAIRYTPWRGYDTGNNLFADSVPTAARLNPMDAAPTINLTTPVNYSTQGVPRLVPVGTKTVNTVNYYIPRYYTTPTVGVPAAGDARTLVEITAGNAPFVGSVNRTDCITLAPVAGVVRCSHTEELQNFANWFTYYRSREYTAKNALGRVIASREGIRVGYHVLNDANDRIAIASMNVSPATDAKRALLDRIYRTNSTGGTPLRQALDAAGRHFECIASDAFGSAASSAPGSAGCPILAAPAGQCQQNYSLVFTDGYWNGADALNPDNRDVDDAAANTPFDGGIFSDGFNFTLADVAMHYYERDLHPTLANEVPTTPRDRAFAPANTFGVNEVMHQHLSTYTISFGLTGNIDPTTIPADITQAVAWGDPSANDTNKVDDLLHTALNGRGQYLSGADPEQLNQRMEEVFAEFGTGAGAASAVSFDDARLDQTTVTNTVRFRGLFDTRSNTGNLLAENINSQTGQTTSQIWSAAERLDAMSPGARVIVTFNPITRAGIAFRHASLTAAQQAQLTADQVNWIRGDSSQERPTGALRERLNLLGKLGDFVHSKPLFVGSPEFNGRDREEYPLSDLYSGFAQSVGNRAKRVFSAANDGMLHGFDAATGDETVAFVPNKLISGTPYASNLAQVTLPTYSHKYFNDLSPQANDVFITPRGGVSRQWRTVLIGGLGVGGKGFYALDVTDPANFANEASAAAQVMWEFTDTDDTYPVDGAGAPLGGSVGALVDFQTPPLPIKDLGYAMSRPQVQMTNAEHFGGEKKWAAIFGNGYNATSGYAKLFVVFVEGGIDGWDPGDVVKLDTGFGVPGAGEQNEGLPNGLGTPLVIDADRNGTADFAYAGDLLGNLYRFDMRDTNPANWIVTRIFQAKYHNNTPANLADDVIQPIYQQPTAIRNPQSDEGFIVIFGTGSYATTPDGTNTSVQSIYGVWDRLENVIEPTMVSNPRRNLVEQVYTNVVAADGRNIRVNSNNLVSYAVPGDPTIPRTRGWVIDLDVPRAINDVSGNPNPDTTGNNPPAAQFPGERAIRNVQIRFGFGFVNSVIPREDATCLNQPGGFSLTFNPATGGFGGLRSRVAFDFNNDGNFNNLDEVGGVPVAGYRLDGTPGDATIHGDLRQYQVNDPDGGVQVRTERINRGESDRSGRLSWKELE